MCLAVVAGSNVGGGAGERDNNGIGGGDGGSGRGNDGRGGQGLRVYLFLPSPNIFLGGAILWGSIFLVRQAFSNHLPY
jgi:hypothetical protein